MTITKRLGTKIAALDHADVTPEALLWAKRGILDTVGVTLAGAEEACSRRVAQMVAIEDGPAARKEGALLFGYGRRTSASNAALVNGTAAHALDFDDCNNTLGGHPSAPILPGLIALGGNPGRLGAGHNFGLSGRLRNRNRDRQGGQFSPLREGLAPDRHPRHVRRRRRRCRS